MADLGLDQIGPRLKGWRQKRGLTLEELSALADVSPSTISRLESGKRAPNLELLIPLATALRIELDEVIPRSAPDPRIRRVTAMVDGARFEHLSPDASPSQAAKITFPAPQPGEVLDPRVHDGYEWLYVLSGNLRLVLDQHDIVMGPGEAAEFDTRVPHAMRSAGPGPVDILAIFSKQGKRIHLRARPTSAGH